MPTLDDIVNGLRDERRVVVNQRNEARRELQALQDGLEALTSKLSGWHHVATADGDWVKADIYQDVGAQLRALQFTKD